MPDAGHRSLELRRAFARGDRAVEPEQDQQCAALIRRQLRFDAEFAAPERIEIDPAQRRDIGRRRDGGRALEPGRIEVENGARAGAVRGFGIPADVERQFQVRGSRTYSDRIEPRRQRRRQWRDQRGDLTKRSGARIQRQPAGGIDAVEIARAFQRHATGLANPQLIDRDRLRIVTQFGDERPQLLAGGGGTADIQ